MRTLLVIVSMIFSNLVFAAQYDPAPGDRMHIQYTGNISTTDAKVIAADAINLDLFDTAQKKTLALNTAGTQCR